MNLKQIIFALSLLIYSFSNAQDGKALFESKCNVCHQISERSTGPALQGAKARWEENSTIENFYEWIKDSKKVLNSGDPYAAKVFADFSNANMPPQQLSNEQIDAIFEYVENPPVTDDGADQANGEKVAAEVEYKPNYKLNEQFFWALLTIGIILVIAIGIFGTALKSLLASEYYKKRVIEKEREREEGTGKNLLGIILLIIAAVSAPLSTLAQSETADDVMVKMSNTEIWFLLAVDLVLLGILFYLGGLIKSTLLSIKTEKQLQALEKQKAEQKTITDYLTDAVDVDNEESIMMDHEYDGIRELDNNLPPWWKWGFYVSIVFAVVYFTYYNLLGGPSQVELYNEDMRIAQIAREEYMKKAAMNVDETNATVLTEASQIASGKAIFDQNCAICHKPDGSGETGPNLTDNTWIYGYDIKDLFKTVSKGTSKGMEPWSRKLNPVQIQEVTSYILTLPEAPNGKKPEGEIIESIEDASSVTQDTLQNAPVDTLAI